MPRRFVRFLRRNTIALLALFIALSGTTYAASTLARNSVGTAQLKNGAVTKKKINKKTIKALKGNRGLRGLTGAQGAPGPRGATGAQGVQGVHGAKGDIGPTFGAINGTNDTPTPTFILNFGATAVDLPVAGALAIIARDVTTYACNASGSCSSQYSIYVDDTAVPHSGMSLSAAASQSVTTPLTIFGIANVSAGQHTITIRTQVAGNWSLQANDQFVISATLLGGAAVAAPTTSRPTRTTAPTSIHR
jgi:hypothetical protein